MELKEIASVIKGQKMFFRTGTTKDVAFRLSVLKKMKQIVLAYENRLYEALWEDMHKPKFESYAGEVGFVLQELNIQIRGIRKWASPKRVKSPLLHFRSRSWVYPEPYGQVLIFSPWNFPFQLSFSPLVGAVAAGNCVVLKPSRHTSNTSAVMKEMIRESFAPEHIAFFSGDREMNNKLLEEKFDYIFFTGSPKVGRNVMKSASENLIPITLELGGKNPCMVHKDASVDLAAKRIIWGKFFNGGQSCVAPDYLLIHKDIKEKFINKALEYLTAFYGPEPSKSPDYLRMVSTAHTEKLEHLLAGGKILVGGKVNRIEKYVAPTIMDEVRPDDPVMQEEIFGPILPVISYTHTEEAVNIINSKSKPLVFYLFTESRKLQENLLKQISSGSVSLNETVKQYINPYLPFGGIGESGMGRYHGKSSFETFSNYKSVLRKTTLFDFPLRYPPYTDLQLKLIKRLIH